MKKMKVLALLLALSVFAGCVCGCGGTESYDSQDGKAGDTLNEIKKRGEIIVGLEGSWAPWSYHDGDELVGMDVELGKKIAEKLDVEVKFKEEIWDDLLKGLSSNSYDVVINGVGITDERKEKYTFSEPYAFSHTVVITRDDSGIRTMYDLEGKTTANTIGSVYEQKGKKYGAKVIGIETFDQAMEKVLKGEVDASINEDATFYQYMTEHKDADLMIAAQDPDVTSIGVAMAYGVVNQSLKKAIDEVIEEMMESGEMRSLSKKYFGSDITKE
ncbi:MAG: transporter substrate-binding domain-containing protein [Eubacterium sp.]|nr:transporter substrate-binding domain-containing protein [Eubacterium sp.]